MKPYRPDTTLYLPTKEGQSYTLAQLLRCSTYTDNEDLKQACFEKGKKMKPGIITTREHWERVCNHIAETTV